LLSYKRKEDMLAVGLAIDTMKITGQEHLALQLPPVSFNRYIYYVDKPFYQQNMRYMSSKL
jgi:hypothetical protein